MEFNIGFLGKIANFEVRLPLCLVSGELLGCSVSDLYINPKTDIGKIQIRLTEENGKNFRGADNRKDNQWQVLVDNRPYRFEGYRVNLNDENGKLITQIRLDAMGKFDLKDLNFQEPTFEVQVMDIDICDRLTVKNLNTGKIRYPECFQK